MKQKNTFAKIFSIIFLVTIAAGFLGGYASKRAIADDPHILKDAFTKIADRMHLHVMMSGTNSDGDFGFFFDDSSDGNFSQSTDKWDLRGSFKEITFKSVSADLLIKENSGPEFKLEAEGLVNKEKTERLLKVISTPDNLLIEQLPHNATKNLKVTLYIPKKFNGEISVKSVSGTLQFQQISAKSLDVKSVSGNILANNLIVESLELKSVSGDVNAELGKSAQVTIVSVSGTVNLKLPSGDSNEFQVKSLSGNIQNTLKSKDGGKYLVQVKTTSGDITID